MKKLRGGAGGQRVTTELLRHFQRASAAWAEPHHCLCPQRLASCLLTKASGTGKNKLQYEKLLVLDMWYYFSCRSVGSTEDLLETSGGGTLHAALPWLSQLQHSGKRCCGSGGSFPRAATMPDCGWGDQAAHLWLALCLLQDTAVKGERRGRACLFGWEHKWKGDCSMMRNCDKSMTDL